MVNFSISTINSKVRTISSYSYNSLQTLILTSLFCVVTTADSMIQGNGKCSIHLKMEVLNAQNQKEQHYCELTLDQFYTFFHELKRAYSLMEVL